MKNCDSCGHSLDHHMDGEPCITAQDDPCRCGICLHTSRLIGLEGYLRGQALRAQAQADTETMDAFVQWAKDVEWARKQIEEKST